MRHLLDQLFGCAETGGDWSRWVASHRPQADVIAWGFAIDPDAMEAAIDRAAELLSIEGPTGVGVVGGIYSAVAARLRAGRPLDPATVRVLGDFAGQYRE